MNKTQLKNGLADGLEDVQGRADTRALPIQRVGVKRVKWPLAWAAEHGIVHSVAEFEMTVSLSAAQKGTHMSRFVAALNDATDANTAFGAAPWSIAKARAFVADLQTRLEADAAYFTCQFPLFLPRTAPVSGITSLMDYQLIISGSAQLQNGKVNTEIRLEIQAPVTSLCPCSKEISAYGAHNQRSHINIAATIAASVADIAATAAASIADTKKDTLTAETMIGWAESSASAQLYPLLKRADEKFVTEQAYDNPRFVEDLIREIALKAAADPRAKNISVEAENFESIHNHSAYAKLWIEA